MAADPISNGYARAFLAQAQAENVIGRVESELHQLRGLLKSNPDLMKFLKDPNIKHEGKRQAIGDLFEGRVHAIVLNGLITLSDLDHAGVLPHIIEEFLALAAASKQKVTGEVTTAILLDDATRQRLVTELGKATGKNVELMERVDPGILGGAIIRVGEEVIDGSLRRKLNDIQERLKQ
jgi:F-type H+-transporting ATPase subunit delta